MRTHNHLAIIAAALLAASATVAVAQSSGSSGSAGGAVGASGAAGAAGTTGAAGTSGSTAPGSSAPSSIPSGTGPTPAPTPGQSFSFPSNTGNDANGNRIPSGTGPTPAPTPGQSTTLPSNSGRPGAGQSAGQPSGTTGTGGPTVNGTDTPRIITIQRSAADQRQSRRHFRDMGPAGDALSRSTRQPSAPSRVHVGVKCSTAPKMLYRTNSRIALSRPSSVKGYMRSPTSCRTMRMDCVWSHSFSGTGLSHTQAG